MAREFPPLLGIRHVALRVQDLSRSEAFYKDVLGFRVEWRPDSQNLYLSSGSDNLALHEAPKDALGQGALDHFGIAVKSSGEVDQWAEHLKGKGVKLAQEPKTHRDGSRSIYFKDPDGNLIQILYHPPISSSL